MIEDVFLKCVSVVHIYIHERLCKHCVQFKLVYMSDDIVYKLTISPCGVKLMQHIYI